MKKISLILLLILIFIFLTLSLVDKSDYMIHKRLWYIQKQFDQVARDPNVVPDEKFKHLVQQYHRIIKQYPHSQKAARVHLQIARVYLLQKQNTSARNTLFEVIKKYPQDSELSAEAFFIIGQIYEEEGNWPEALKYYEKIQNEYALSTIGLSIPLFLAQSYLKRNEPVKAGASFEKALNFYRRIAAEHPNSDLGFNSLRFMATTNFSLEQWREGIQDLGRVLDEYSQEPYLNPQRAHLILRTISQISIIKLKDYDLAIGIYEKFVFEHPQHPLIPRIQEMIKNLKILQEKGITISVQE